jgi:anti-sigma regulatory factor (Ser/Thr protein kinase)/anti-anti-sigma regulatory factor
MSLSTRRPATVRLPADLDESTLSGFREELMASLRERPEEIAIDCSLLEHASSGHINALWKALTTCERAGVPLKLSSVGYGLERVLKVLDIYDMFMVERASEEPPQLEEWRGLVQTGFEHFQVEIDPTLDDITGALLGFHDFLRKADVSEICAFDLETVFYEVATNIRRHSGLGPDGAISFSATLDADGIRMGFTDAGSPFDPTGKPPGFDPRQAIRNRQRNGIGLTMIRRLVDDISYERVDGTFNVVTLRKKLSRCRR